MSIGAKIRSGALWNFMGKSGSQVLGFAFGIVLARLLAATPQSESQLAARIAGKGPWKKRLPDLLQTLVALGRARQEGESWSAI